jgi:hypothetical protein
MGCALDQFLGLDMIGLKLFGNLLELEQLFGES